MRLFHRSFVIVYLAVLTTGVTAWSAESLTRTGDWTVSCGNRPSTASYRITEPSDGSGSPKRFALILNGSPATHFFGDSGKKYQGLITSLNQAGFRVLELKYASNPMECGSAGTVQGFFSACCGQGLSATFAHDEQIYDLAVEQLGYQADHSDQQMLGFGFSLGALQLETMAYVSGRKFTKVALTGILAGNSKDGCKKSNTNPATLDGMAWTGYADLADLITQSTRGCTQKDNAALEYTETYNFDQMPYRYLTDLALFEGMSSLLGGHPKQAEYIFKARKISPTLMKTYSACGHNSWECVSGGNKLNTDIMKWVNH